MAFTFGAANQPNSATLNFEDLVATSLANYRKTLADNISAANAFFYLLSQSDCWDRQDGGLYVAQDLLYGLGSADTYAGYDELSVNPPSGITQAIWEWRQIAAPFAFSEEERKKNKHRIVPLIESRLNQVEVGMKELWSKMFFWGSYAHGGTTLKTPYQSPANGSYGIEPLFKLIDPTPTTSVEVGGINQSTYSWWRNQVKDANAITTYLGFIGAILNLYNTCTKGVNGAPNLILADQISWELLALAYYQKYQARMEEDANFPFPNLKFFKAKVVWDEYMPDAGNDDLDPTSATSGTMVFLNTKFFKITSEAETHFEWTNLQKPMNQDAKVKHLLWMGTDGVSNRRKQGVMFKIPRSLS